VINDLGLDMAQLEAATPRTAVGGPFVPVKLSTDASAFERQLYRINITRVQVEKLNRTLALVPYRKPVIGEVEFTSGFGVRSDPFLGRPAMHTGLDFRASTGDPVRATANGKVAASGWQGGYGRMVEIDHGNGLSTRYGHLSEINVKVGDTVKIGQVIGEVGSTGRSTGPHLHYETRIDGDAVDPQKFLRAGVRLSSGEVTLMRRVVADLAGDDIAEQAPGLAVELHELHLLDREEVIRAGVDLDSGQHHLG